MGLVAGKVYKGPLCNIFVLGWTILVSGLHSNHEAAMKKYSWNNNGLAFYAGLEFYNLKEEAGTGGWTVVNSLGRAEIL